MKPFAVDCLSRLQASADVAIWQSHNNTPEWNYRRSTSRRAPEEDYVASFILQGLPVLAENWMPLFRQWNMNLRLTGVFCHQTPKARFTRAGLTVSPELADLLIVRRHVYSSNRVKQVAVLVQAKMSDTGEITLPCNDNQLYLYTSWPEFQLKGTNAPVRTFSIGLHCEQALYAGISQGFTPDIPRNEGWSSFCPWAMMPPKRSGWVEDSLSLYLIKLLNFEAGREFFDPTVTDCHWSELIHYLLDVTFALPLRTRDIRRSPDVPRGRTISFNRMGFMSETTAPQSIYVPNERARELINNSHEFQSDELGERFYKGGAGRVLLIETWQEIG